MLISHETNLQRKKEANIDSKLFSYLIISYRGSRNFYKTIQYLLEEEGNSCDVLLEARNFIVTLVIAKLIGSERASERASTFIKCNKKGELIIVMLPMPQNQERKHNDKVKSIEGFGVGDGSVAFKCRVPFRDERRGKLGVLVFLFLFLFFW